FKEWAGVCEALAQGRQTLILRKGGIAEGSHGFAPEHDAFWLWPTRLHEGQQGLREAVAGPTDRESKSLVPIRALATVASIAWVRSLETPHRLTPFPVGTEETIAKRFHYRRPGLWVLDIRVYARVEPWLVEDLPQYAGCVSWVPLVEPLATEGLAPVLD